MIFIAAELAPVNHLALSGRYDRNPALPGCLFEE